MKTLQQKKQVQLYAKKPVWKFMQQKLKSGLKMQSLFI